MYIVPLYKYNIVAQVYNKNSNLLDIFLYPSSSGKMESAKDIRPVIILATCSEFSNSPPDWKNNYFVILNLL